jgi:endonuclease/exonuclease/phosphatase family metal-dependent hydrolase
LKSRSLRVGSWNIGASRDVKSIFGTVRALDLDICLLQEVALDSQSFADWESRAKDSGKDGFVFLCNSALATISADFHPSRQYGIATILKRSVKLSGLTSFLLSPFERQRLTAENEQRLLQILSVEAGERLIIANTHLAHTEGWAPSQYRRAQIGDISLYLQPLAASGPAILGGDFNVTSGSAEMDQLRQTLPHAFVPEGESYVGETPGRTIDYFISNKRLQARVSLHQTREITDHNLVVLDVEDW